MTQDQLVAPCPLQRHAIEVVLLDESECGVSDVQVELRGPDARVLSDLTGVDGSVRFDGLPSGSYTIGLPELDREAWSPLRQAALPPGLAASSGDAPWAAPAAAIAAAPLLHRTEPGDCLSSIALRYGFFPDTIWAESPNQALPKDRSQGWTLKPGDRIQIPAKRPGELTAAVGQRYVLRRRGVPEILRLRFLDVHGAARAGVAYLFAVRAASGDPIADRTGKTDGQGFLSEPIPPDAIDGQIQLQSGDGVEIYDYKLGTVDPNSECSGWMARLWNLGFQWTVRDAPDPDQLKEMLSAFQVLNNLPVTGEPDEATRGKLETLHLS